MIWLVGVLGALILLVQRSNRALRFDGPDKVRFSGSFEDEEQRFAAAAARLEALAGCVTAARLG